MVFVAGVAVVFDNYTLFTVAFDSNGEHYAHTGICPVAGIYVAVHGAEAFGAVVAGGG